MADEAPKQEAPKKKKTGRPHKEIDQTQFENLCKIQCTEVEICDWFDVSDKTLNSWCKRTYGHTFSEVFRMKRGAGKISLRRAQMKLAERDSRMAIWMGKQYLDQHEPQPKPEVEELADDGFLDALHGEAKKAWQE